MKRFVVWPLSLVLAACASQPVEDVQPGERPAVDSDEAGLWRMLEMDEYKLRTSTEVIREPALQAYLESVLCRVAPEHCADIRLYLLPSAYLNAAMAPNGMMLVSTGLLVRLANEAQLAAVLGHEAAHYVKRHSLQRWRDVRAKADTLQTMAMVLAAGVGVARANAQSAAAAGNYHRSADRYARARRAADLGTTLLYSLQISSVFGHLAYSREQEMESDELGVSWMATAGYDPDAAADIWDYVRVEAEAAGRWVPTLWRTHPRPGARERRAREQAVVLGDRASPTTGQDAFASQVEPFRNDWLHLARLGLEIPVLAVLLERQRQVGVPEGLVSFHEGSMYRSRGEEGDDERALASFEAAVEQDDFPPEALRELGIARWDAQRTAGAREAFEHYLAAAPTAPDAAMVASYIAELR